MLDKVYAIIYREQAEDGSYSSGLCYVYDTEEKAKNTLNIIKLDEISKFVEGGWSTEKVVNEALEETDNRIRFDFLDEYVEYEIIEMEVK